jgi:hypothetical protein
MPFRTVWAICWLLTVVFRGDFAWAAEQHRSLQLMTKIQPRAALSLNRAQISFTGAEGQRLISSQEGAVQVTVKVRASSSKATTLNLRAESDLEGNSGYIPIKQVAWVCQGSENNQGLLSATHSQMASRWTTSGIHQASIQFMLQSDGKLPPGQYATFVDFTLTSP